MFETDSEGQQYIAGLKSQLAPIKSRLEYLDGTPKFVRQRKGMEAEFLSVKQQVTDLEAKIKMAQTRYAEMMAMDEAQRRSSELGGSMQRNIKIVAIGSAVVLVLGIVGLIIYKKVKK